MLDDGAEQLVLKLEEVFQGKEELISNGRIRVCLTASTIVFLNKCFEDIHQHTNSQNRIIEYLKQCAQSIHTLKIVQGLTFKFNHVIDISHFQAVQVLQIEKIAIGYVSGLQTLRPRIKVLKAGNSVEKINDILTLCGYDGSTAFTWPYLEVADFSFNTISSLDSSLRLLTSVRHLNVSHNGLTTKDNIEENEWMCLPEVTYLNLGYNQLTKVPSFPDKCCSRITTLILCNNDLTGLEGVEMLQELESLDVSTNCISRFSSLSSLVRLHRLASINCYSNPISFDKRYRSTLTSYLSPSPRRAPIFLDGKELNAVELYSLGQSREVVLSNYIPTRPCGTPFHIQNDPEAFISSGEYSSTPRTPEEKRKNRKSVVRRPSIHNIGDEQEKKMPRAVSISGVETKEELEKLEKLRKDAGEDYLVVRNQEQLKKNDQEFLFDISSEQPIASTSSEIAETENVDFLQSPESPSFHTTDVMHELLHGETSSEIFLVSKTLTEETNSGDIFVTIKDHEIVEMHAINGEMLSRLDLNGLLCVNMIPGDEKIGIVLKFSHVHKERKYREYLFDDEGQCEKFVSLLKDFIQEPINEDKVPDKRQCIRCSTWYNTEKEVSRCKNCGSSFVFEVMKDEGTKQQQSKTDVTARQPDVQDPDLIPSLVRHAPLPPDICISGSDTNTSNNTNKSSSESTDKNSSKNREKNSPEVDSEYGALVSSIHVRTKENYYEDSFNNEDYDASCYTSTKSLLQNSPSPALAISLDSLDNKIPESPLASSYSSQSGSESRNPTPVRGKSSSKIHFSSESCTHCDHRLKLYLETKLFRGGEEEEFRCMIKCPVASYGHAQGRPALLVISNTIAYICKITGIESTRPREWLSIKVCYLLTDLRYIEYGLQSQSFRLEFAEPSGCHTFLVGDRKRCENFLTTFRSVAKAAHGDSHKSLRIGKANPQTQANIRIQVFGVKDESLMFKGRRLYEQAANFTNPPLLKDNKVWFRTLPQSMSGVEFIDWLISRKEASSYGEAVHIGQLLLNAGAIQCFNKDCGFLEKDQYYHFNLSVESHEDEASDSSQDNNTKATDANTIIKQYILAQWKEKEKSTPISIFITNSHIALAEENHQWPLPLLHDPPKVLSGPQFVLKKKQQIINITEVKLFPEFPCEIEIEFQDEDTPESIEDDRWLVVLQSENSLNVLLDAIKELWEKQFAIDLPINILTSFC